MRGAGEALVLAAGAVTPTARLRRLAAAATVVIAADGGLRHAAALGVTPARVVGDLDSVRREDLERWPGMPVERHPSAKDELDLELAVEAALADGSGGGRLRLAGALGGRTDQTLAALLLAARLRRERGVRCALDDGLEEVAVLGAGDALEPALPAGRRLSLLALTDGARVDASGVRWPLEDAALPFGSGLGVSNESLGAPGVRVRSGLVAVMLDHGGEEER